MKKISVWLRHGDLNISYGHHLCNLDITDFYVYQSSSFPIAWSPKDNLTD